MPRPSTYDWKAPFLRWAPVKHLAAVTAPRLVSNRTVVAAGDWLAAPLIRSSTKVARAAD